MAQSSNTLHESAELLSAELVDRHRAIVSLMEELEAVDWYDQRVSACTDDELRRILAHNRDEEKEHASMVLEWLRRHDPVWDEHLRRYLFSEGPIGSLESEPGAGADGSKVPAAVGTARSLGLGKLRAEVER